MAGGWRVTTAERAFIESDRLVLATPAAATATLLAPHAPAAAAALRAIPHAPVAVVCVGFRARRPTSAWISTRTASSSRAAKASSCSAASTRHRCSPAARPKAACCCARCWAEPSIPAWSTRDDAAIAAQAVGDLRRVTGLAREPDFIDVWRARPGIPQYDLAHADRVREVDDAVARLRGLAVIGNALRGVGVNDCIAAAARLASAEGADTRS